MKFAETHQPSPTPATIAEDAFRDACFVCIRWGEKYSTRYVAKLFQACRRHLPFDIPFFCISDEELKFDFGKDSDEPAKIRVVSPPNDFPGWWQKINLFRTDLFGKRYVVYCDLDVVVLQNLNFISRYLGKAELTFAQDLLDPMSSSFMIIDTESLLAHDVVSGFDYNDFRNVDCNDQSYFSRFVTSSRYRTCGLLPHEHYSYKYLVDHDRWQSRSINPAYRLHVLSDIHTLNFHGVPNPHDLESQPERWPLAAEVIAHW